MLRKGETNVALCLLLSWCWVCAGAAEPASARAQGAANLIKNGDFEGGTAGAESKGKFPSGWQGALGYDARNLEMSTDVRPGSKGKQSLCIRGAAEYNGGGVSGEMIALEPNKALRLSGWFKPGNEKSGPSGFYFGVFFFDKDRKPALMNKQHKQNYTYVNWTSKQGDWYYCEMTYPPAREAKDAYGNEIPLDAAFFQVALFTLNYPHAAWFDDIEARMMTAEEIKAQQPPPSVAAPAAAPAQAQTSAPAEWGVAWVGPKQARDAAQELARYLGRVLGQTVVAAEWKPGNARRVFLVTDAAHAPEALAAKLAGKRLDAFAIEYPVTVDGQSVCMMVSHDELGCDYPVYHFLTRYMDVHWVGPGELGIVLQPKPGWAFPERISVLENPAFEMRFWSGASFTCREWLARGGRMGFHHALGSVYSPALHKDAPEVFPLIAGKRYIPPLDGSGSAGWQPCTSSPKSIEIAVKHVLDTYAKNPTTGSVSLSVNDGAGNTCECDLCRALDGDGGRDAEGRENLSNRFYHFYNTVIERVRKELPNARIAVVAYGPVKKPPTQVKVAPGIEVFLVAPSIPQLRAWKECGAATSIYLWLWDGGFLTVRPDLQTIADIVRVAHAQGGIGCYSEQIVQWIVGGPRFYVLSRLLWDPSTDPYAALDEYLRYAYGPAAPAVRGYFDRWEAVYRRRPADQLSSTSWGWRSPEQLRYLTQDDLAFFDKSLADARAAQLTADQAQRLSYLTIHQSLIAANARQYLAAAELTSADWLRAHGVDDVLRLGEEALPLTAEFDRIWATHYAADKTGWFEDKSYTDERYRSFTVSIRVMIASNLETALDQAMAQLTQRMAAAQTKEKALATWEAELQKHPKLAMFIGPQINALKGIAPQDVLVNGNFAKGQPGNPPALEGAWDFYQNYGMVKGSKSEYRWEPGSGHAGGRAIAFGQGNFPEMKTLVALEKNRRYALSLWYKTEKRKTNAGLNIYAYDGPLASVRDIDYKKIHTYFGVTLEPTDGQWRQVTRTLTPTQSGTFVIELAAYYQAAGVWTYWDDMRIERIW